MRSNSKNNITAQPVAGPSHHQPKPVVVEKVVVAERKRSRSKSVVAALRDEADDSEQEEIRPSKKSKTSSSAVVVVTLPRSPIRPISRAVTKEKVVTPLFNSPSPSRSPSPEPDQVMSPERLRSPPAAIQHNQLVVASSPAERASSGTHHLAVVEMKRATVVETDQEEEDQFNDDDDEDMMILAAEAELDIVDASAQSVEIIVQPKVQNKSIDLVKKVTGFRPPSIVKVLDKGKGREREEDVREEECYYTVRRFHYLFHSHDFHADSDSV